MTTHTTHTFVQKYIHKSDSLLIHHHCYTVMKSDTPQSFRQLQLFSLLIYNKFDESSIYTTNYVYTIFNNRKYRPWYITQQLTRNCHCTHCR